jgi:hypothetical protein
MKDKLNDFYFWFNKNKIFDSINYSLQITTALTFLLKKKILRILFL